jgi:hypothetical protein
MVIIHRNKQTGGTVCGHGLSTHQNERFRSYWPGVLAGATGYQALPG